MAGHANEREHVERAGAATCRACGYDLAGLTHCAACPECGTITDQSRAVLLTSAPPDYLDRIKLGARIQHAGAWLALIACTWGFLQLFVPETLNVSGLSAASEGTRAFVRDLPVLCRLLAWGVGLGAVSFVATGWWLLSARLPGAPDADQPPRRRMLRTWLAVTLAGTTANVMLAAVSATHTDEALLQFLVLLVTIIASAVLLHAPGPLMQSLARRIPNDDVSRKADIFHMSMQAAVTITIVGWPVAICAGLSLPWGGPAGNAVMLVATGVTVLLAAGVLVTHLIMCAEFRRAIDRVEPQSPG